LVKLRYFAGLTLRQIAELMGISLRSANRLWSFAKVWLYDRLTEKD
jgi:DNA-directed RNA polymerase specialized sigma24 family protein